MAYTVALGGLFHETNTFLRHPTELSAFDIFEGGALLDLEKDRTPLSGFLQTARALDWRVVPTAYFRARPSGMVADAVIEAFWEGLRAPIDSDLDAVFLVLHGAMVSPTFLDVEGEILKRLRRQLGPEIPIYGVLDLHANHTAAMAADANCLLAYRQNPHTDAFETAVRATHFLARGLELGRFPTTAWHHSRHLLTAIATDTADEPVRCLEAIAREIEDAEEAVLAVNVLAGFAHADTPESGVSYSIIHDGSLSDDALASHFARLDEALHARRDAVVVEWDLVDALERIQTEADYPALLVESADNIGGGAPGDSTTVLQAMLEAGINQGGVILCDPESVARLGQAKPGSTHRLPLGGKSGELGSRPLTLDVTFVRRTDGRFQLEDPHSHLASSVGLDINMGPCAVVKHDGILILLTSVATPPFDLGQWRSQGVEPSELNVIGVKAAVAHRQAYRKISRAHYPVQTIGPCSNDLVSLPYQHLRHPIWPLDPTL